MRKYGKGGSGARKNVRDASVADVVVFAVGLLLPADGLYRTGRGCGAGDPRQGLVGLGANTRVHVVAERFQRAAHHVDVQVHPDEVAAASGADGGGWIIASGQEQRLENQRLPAPIAGGQRVGGHLTLSRI